MISNERLAFTSELLVMWYRKSVLSSLSYHFTRKKISRAQQGLYHGKSVQHGHNVSFSMHKTKRTWKPNVHWKSFHSDLLGTSFQVRVSTTAMRCIDKAGGIDSYILFTKPHKLDSEIGERLRVQLKKKWEEKHGRKFRRSTERFEERKARYQTQIRYNDACRDQVIQTALKDPTYLEKLKAKKDEASSVSAVAETPEILVNINVSNETKNVPTSDVEY